MTGIRTTTRSAAVAADHLRQLDGVRGIAVLMVMWFHFFQNSAAREHGPLFAAIDAVTPLGRTGVDLFFVLSGFLITRILMASAGTERYFVNFYGRRFLRIFPLYYFFLVVALLLVPALTDRPITPLSEQWYWWVHLQNLPLTFGWPSDGPNVYWSLAVEEHFYLVWPLLVLATPRHHLGKLAMTVIASAFVIRLAMMRLGFDTYYFTLTRMDTLAVGSLLAVHESTIRSAASQWHRRLSIAAVAAGFPVAAILISVGGAGGGVLQAVRYTMQAGMYGGVVGVAITATPAGLVDKILCWRPLVYTGAISFGLYVYHRSAYAIVDEQLDGLPLLQRGAIGVAIAFCVASASAVLIERPFLALKRHFPQNARSAG